MIFHGYTAEPDLTAPALGAHTRAVLRDLGGMPDDEIDDLEERGVVHCAPDRVHEPRSAQW